MDQPHCSYSLVILNIDSRVCTAGHLKLVLAYTRALLTWSKGSSRACHTDSSRPGMVALLASVVLAVLSMPL